MLKMHNIEENKNLLRQVNWCEDILIYIFNKIRNEAIIWQK